jgi:hypothetical protein
MPFPERRRPAAVDGATPSARPACSGVDGGETPLLQEGAFAAKAVRNSQPVARIERSEIRERRLNRRVSTRVSLRSTRATSRSISALSTPMLTSFSRLPNDFDQVFP